MNSCSKKKKIVILGSTGSIGESTCRVVKQLGDRFEIVGLAAGANTQAIYKQVQEFHPKAVALEDSASADELRQRLGNDVDILEGISGIIKIAGLPEADMVVCAIVGAAGLLPTAEAVRAGKDIALANKEVLVAAGNIVMRMARESGSRILPVDSEHSALFQCIGSEDISNVRRLILTASGGPFWDMDISEFENITPETALRHPRWKMGSKVTVDSATMMNKGFEIIEAKWLFGIDIDKIDVVIHPQSIIHSMVEFNDGVIMAQMSEPDMEVPIQYALTYPERVENKMEPFDFVKNDQLIFKKPDPEKFPCLELARRAAKIGGTMPTVLNAANEVAVARFLRGDISFTGIPRLIREAMDEHQPMDAQDIETILAVDQQIRKECFV